MVESFPLPPHSEPVTDPVRRSIVRSQGFIVFPVKSSIAVRPKRLNDPENLEFKLTNRPWYVYRGQGYRGLKNPDYQYDRYKPHRSANAYGLYGSPPGQNIHHYRPYKGLRQQLANLTYGQNLLLWDYLVIILEHIYGPKFGRTTRPVHKKNHIVSGLTGKIVSKLIHEARFHLR